MGPFFDTQAAHGDKTRLMAAMRLLGVGEVPNMWMTLRHPPDFKLLHSGYLNQGPGALSLGNGRGWTPRLMELLVISVELHGDNAR